MEEIKSGVFLTHPGNGAGNSMRIRCPELQKNSDISNRK